MGYSEEKTGNTTQEEKPGKDLQNISKIINMSSVVSYVCCLFML